MTKIIQYRNSCIGCGICQELQPEMWRMSKKDGKATLLKAVERNGVFILKISGSVQEKSETTAVACPVRIIKVV
ncbi:MAG: ferredoxin [Bacteroidota bacterium]